MFIHFHMEIICSSSSAKHLGILSVFDLIPDKSKCLGNRMNYFPNSPKLSALSLFGMKVPWGHIGRKTYETPFWKQLCSLFVLLNLKSGGPKPVQ